MPRIESTLLAIAMLRVVASGVAVAEVNIVAQDSPLDVHAAGYEARVEPDGCLTSLRIGGREFLAPGVSISRGSYFYQNGPLKLTNIKRPVSNVIEASSDLASVRYEFDENSMTWRLANHSDSPLVLFFVLAKEAEALLNHDEAFLPPVNEPWNKVTVVVGDGKLTIRGCDKLWGPWQGPYQVCQVSLEAGEVKQIELMTGLVSSEERARIQALKQPLPDPELRVLSPRQYQVFQRSTASEGTVNMSGHTTTDATEIEYRVTGESLSGPLPDTWQHLPIVESTRAFGAQLTLPAGGWYTLEVRALAHGEVAAETKVGHFGVGEVFVGAGQSNSTNCGQFRTQQTSGMVSSFSGSDWRLADDPQPGVADRSEGGSFWPAFGDAMYKQFHVPIGVATTGFGGTSVNQWQPDGDLFPWTMTRIEQLGPFGFRALLWHQGESDVEMASDEYYAKLKNVIQSSRAQAGWQIPWFVAEASYHNPEQPRYESVRSAQEKLWTDGIALPGPDTDTLTGQNRDLDGLGIHFSPTGLRAHGQMWAEKVGEYLDKVLEQ